MRVNEISDYPAFPWIKLGEVCSGYFSCNVLEYNYTRWNYIPSEMIAIASGWKLEIKKKKEKGEKCEKACKLLGMETQDTRLYLKVI